MLPLPPDISPAAQRTLRHALATHFPSFLRKAFVTLNPGQRFISSWHLDAISEYLSALDNSDIQRLIINMPPRALKSLSVTVAWSCFLLGRTPQQRIITASYSSALSLKHAIDSRALVLCPWFRQVFPEFALMPGQNEKHRFATTQHGFRLATSVGGTLTGEGGDVLILDDPLNPAQAASVRLRKRANQWFDHTFATRLNDKRHGRMLIVMQRLHEEDLTGHLLHKGGWEHLCLPAQADERRIISIGRFHHEMQEGELLQPVREPDAVLRRLREDLGAQAFAAQYLQQPHSEAGQMIRREWLHDADMMPSGYDMLVQSWDTAIKSGAGHDYSVCMTVGVQAGCYYVCDVLRVRLDYPDLRRAVLTQYARLKPDAVLIEDKASGQSLLQDMRSEASMPVIAIQPKGDKVQRAARITPLLESGKVRLVRHASWRDALDAELLAFPHGAHDDQVDALTQALEWMRERGAGGVKVRVL